MNSLEPLESRTLCSAAPIPIPSLPGDVSGDGTVNIADMAFVANNWNAAGANNPADANHDGIVNIADMGVVASNWNRTLYDGHTATIGGVLNVWAPNPADTGGTWNANQTSLYG